MATIEERAEKWAHEYMVSETVRDDLTSYEQDLIAAYLAGSAQTQADYSAWAALQLARRMEVGE